MKRYETYKDSGIQWVGEIPSHWDSNKLKFFADISTGTTPSTEEMRLRLTMCVSGMIYVFFIVLLSFYLYSLGYFTNTFLPFLM